MFRQREGNFLPHLREPRQDVFQMLILFESVREKVRPLRSQTVDACRRFELKRSTKSGRLFAALQSAFPETSDKFVQHAGRFRTKDVEHFVEVAEKICLPVFRLFELFRNDRQVDRAQLGLVPAAIQDCRAPATVRVEAFLRTGSVVGQFDRQDHVRPGPEGGNDSTPRPPGGFVERLHRLQQDHNRLPRSSCETFERHSVTAKRHSVTVKRCNVTVEQLRPKYRQLDDRIDADEIDETASRNNWSTICRPFRFPTWQRR